VGVASFQRTDAAVNALRMRDWGLVPGWTGEVRWRTTIWWNVLAVKVSPATLPRIMDATGDNRRAMMGLQIKVDNWLKKG